MNENIDIGSSSSLSNNGEDIEAELPDEVEAHSTPSEIETESVKNETGETFDDSDGNLTDKIVVPSRVLPCIVFSQFAGTSLWFAGNAVLPDFTDELDLPDSSLEILTSAVQAGFILGTLLLAVTNLVDRVLPTHIFLASAISGACMNALIPTLAQGLGGMTVLRFLTGFSLAGIYPVGMKVAADWYRDGLGRALGLLVGALVAGTAFPFILREIPQSWELLLYETSALAAFGGVLLVLVVPNGPYRKASSTFDPSLVFTLFQSREFSAAAHGYFGHMWELYAFIAWCPVVWEAYLDRTDTHWSASLVTFVVVSSGAVGCVVGGLLTPRFGSGRVALVSLAVSGTCCLVSPLLYYVPVPEVTLIFYLVWGATVAADSPQFSSLVAQTAPAEQKGTALTVVNCIGFAVSIGSIILLGVPVSEAYLMLLLFPGPAFGCYRMRRFLYSRDGNGRTSRLEDKSAEK